MKQSNELNICHLLVVGIMCFVCYLNNSNSYNDNNNAIDIVYVQKLDFILIILLQHHCHPTT